MTPNVPQFKSARDAPAVDAPADDVPAHDVPTLGPEAGLPEILAAWQTATRRLEQTHESLRSEVRRLTDELEIKNRELARKNRLADLGQMASHVAHEVRNSLMPLTLYLSLLRRRVGNGGEDGRILDKIDAGLAALDATVNDLLHFTSDRDPSRQSVRLRDLADEVCQSVAPQLAAQRIETLVEVPDTLTVTADANMLRRALLNLVLNALDAMAEGGRLLVTGTGDAHRFELTVADTGPGLDASALERAFEPFFTTKSGGTGLGLAIVCRIAEVHGGRATAANRDGPGAAFTLLLPVLPMESAA